MQDTWVWSLGQEDPLEKGMTTHSSILAWRIPWTEEPGGLYSPWGRKVSDMTERLTLSDAGDVGLIPGQEAQTHMPHSQKKKKKQQNLKREAIS